MDSRVFYGEFSLRHWIQMLLTGDIVLPEYQRSFVWDERDVRRLIKSFQDGQFVQPVTIALYKLGSDSPGKNLIIDGQQRLSTILLAYLGFMPIKSKFEKPEHLANDEDDAADELLENTKGPIKWRFVDVFTTLGDNSRDGIIKRLESDSRYSPLQLGLSREFFDKTFLGYSYIVPVASRPDAIQRGFSQLFRDINYYGKKLSALESRRSLYYLNDDLLNYFEGHINDGSDVLCDIQLIEKMMLVKIDFVRYLSILSQFYVSKNAWTVLLGYSASSSREGYYADYVSYLLELEQEDREDKFNGFVFEAVFPDSCWKARYVTLKETIKRLKGKFRLQEHDTFKSWIDADYWLFGLVYYIVFEGKELKEELKDLEETINKEVDEKKQSDYYAKSPNRLGNLRERLGRSISIIGEYVQ